MENTTLQPPIPSRLRALAYNDAALALLAFLVSLALYLPTLSPSVVIGDGGDLQAQVRMLGVTHPTSYPLFILVGRLISYLPLGDVAFRVTLFCTVAAAAAVALLYLTCRELGAGRAPALAAALLMAAAPRLWMHAAAAEVYPLSSMFILLCTWLLLRWGGGQTHGSAPTVGATGARQIPLWVVTLAFGFGLTHHISLRLFGPAALAYVLIVEPRLPLRPKRWLPALACLLLPLALYAYIPLRAAHFMAQPELAGQVLGVRKLVASGYITPHYFGGGALDLILALGYSQQVFGSSDIGLGILGRYFQMTAEQFPLAIVGPIALLGLVVLLRRKGKPSVYLILGYLVSLVSALKFLATVGEDGDHFIPAYLLTAIWFSAGAQALLAWLRRRMPARAWLATALSAALFLLPAYSAATNFPQMLARRQLDVGPQARAALGQALPAGAVLAGPWNDITPLRYMQRVEGLRPDVWTVATDAAGIRTLTQRAIDARQPLYAVRATEAGLRLLPLPVWDEAVITHPADVRLNAAARWRGYDLELAAPRAGAVLRLTLYWETDATPDQGWTTFVHLLDARGETVAQVDREPVGAFYPPTEWQGGLLLADQYELALPADLPAGSYRLVFGAYTGEERLDWADGQDTQEIAQLDM